MPEGHTIHRLARDHGRHFVGQKLAVSSPQGRFQSEAELLCGKRLTSVEAFGKHLFYRFGSSTFLHVHLGLYGKFRLLKKPLPAPKGAVRVRAIGDTHGFDLNGPNQCELLTKAQTAELVSRLGEDPLRKDSDLERLWKRLSKTKRAIGAILLDQSMICGVGNIYRSEILFLLGIDPQRPGNQIAKEQLAALWSLTQSLLEIGVKYNRIITVDRQLVDKPLSKLTSGERLNIYKKEHCPRCGSLVSATAMAARTLYFCGYCQTS